MQRLPRLKSAIFAGDWPSPLAFSIVQAATQVQEVTLVFIPKMLAVGFVMWMLGPWMFEELNVLMGEVSMHVSHVVSGGR